MPALNFKAQFADDVEHGNKLQTVRAPRKDGCPHCRPGDHIKLYTGMRTNNCRLLGEAIVKRVAAVRIESTCMYVNGRILPTYIYDRGCEQTDSEFALADGFASFMDMANWFDDLYGLPFDGVLIEWELQ